MNLIEIKNPRFASSENDSVMFDVRFDDVGYDEILVARPSDGPTAQYFAAAIAGEYGPIAPYVAPPEPTEAELLQQWRSRTEVSRFQARAALLQAGLLPTIEAYMADPETPMIQKIAWQDAQVFRRMSPTVLALQHLLGVTDEQLDDLFRVAATIQA